jgi:hypothetical protein
MRGINITNEKKRDAMVAYNTGAKKAGVTMVLQNGEEKRNVRFIKTLITCGDLLKKYGSPAAAGKAIIETDDDTDIEIAGKILGKTSKLYKTGRGEIAYSVNLVEVLRNPDGSEKERRSLAANPANICAEIPLQWTGRTFSREAAVRKFVFTKSYQLYHTNGLTYDFLFEMAKRLHEEKVLVFIGAGKKGTERIYITAGGEPYRGFLEGRVNGEKYLLILHLAAMELKPLGKGGRDEQTKSV